MSEPLFGPTKLGFGLVETPAAEVLHLYIFEPVPDPLVWVEVRSITWQLLQVEPLGRPAGEKRPDVGSPVCGKPIPNHRQFSFHLPQDVTKKLRLLPSRGSNLRRRACRAYRPEQVRLSPRGDRSPKAPFCRCFSVGRIRPNRRRQLVKFRLIDKHHGSIVSLGFF